MLHHRSDKNSHLDTVLYEIDMLRHCSNKLAAKKAKKMAKKATAKKSGGKKAARKK